MTAKHGRDNRVSFDRAVPLFDHRYLQNREDRPTPPPPSFAYGLGNCSLQAAHTEMGIKQHYCLLQCYLQITHFPVDQCWIILLVLHLVIHRNKTYCMSVCGLVILTCRGIWMDQLIACIEVKN